MKFYRNQDWLIQKYINEKLSTIKIAKICNVTEGTIRNWMKKYKVGNSS